MVKLGIVFGCFIPLHTGHLSILEKALEENDKVIVGICGYDGDRGKDFIPFRDRIELTKKALGKMSSKIVFSVIDDKKIGLSGKFDHKSWELWSGELFRNVEIPEGEDKTWITRISKTTWYTGEQSYNEVLSSIYKNHKFVFVERSIIPISGTMIRQEPQKYIDKIHPEFIEYLKRKNII